MVLGLNRPAYHIVIGILLVLSALTAAAMQFSASAGQEEDLPRLFAIGSSDTGAKEVPLKGTRQNGDITKVSDFKIDFNNVIQIPQEQNLVLFPDSSAEGFILTKAKLINEQKQTIYLDPVSNQKNAFSLDGIPNGVYTLNVVGRLGDIEGGYESILVIIPPDQPTTIINEETKKEVQKRIKQILLIDIYVTIIFEEPEPSPCYFDPSLDECKPVNGKCPPGFGFNEDEQCIPHGKCPDGYGRLDDDETGKCYKNSDIKKCPDGYITHKDDECPKPMPVTPPVNSCECPIGEACPAVVCEQPLDTEELQAPTPPPATTNSTIR